MSFYNFPPLNTEGRPYAIQEFNGQFITGTKDEFLAVNKCRLLADYPSIDRTQLSAQTLRHCISKDDMKNVFAQKDGRLDFAWNQLTSEGFSGVVKRVADAAEPTRLWPIARLSRGVLKMHNGITSIAGKIMQSKGFEKIEDIMDKYSTTQHWKNNWVRCIAIHPTSSRLAICQSDDYVRVFNACKEARTPLTLKHEKQNHVSSMEWEPHDQRVLAIAANGLILIWKLGAKSTNIRHCAKIIDTGLSSITSLVWDKMANRCLLLCSTETTKIIAVNTLHDENEYLATTWSWSSPVRLIPSPDGTRIALLYTGNMLRIYNRITWESEKFAGLKGRVIDAVWGSGGETLIFATEESHQLFAVVFQQIEEKSWEGKNEMKWITKTSPHPIFDLTPVEFDSVELELQGSAERPIIEIGGKVHKLALSPDGKRLAICFKDFPSIVATFIVECSPALKLEPCAFAEAPNYGSATIIAFLPKFAEGSLLLIVWSGGHIQYLPFIYNQNTSMIIPITNILDEISGTTFDYLKRRSISDSLRSDDLPSGICNRSEDQEEELMSERIKRSRQV